ncbi:MAG: hypothetical protein LW599_04035 [Rickettsiaceae bacterium]|jgi:hypothetical protein|nr:hypothetical protein [Rickettsiaceae bacterium]
MSKNKKILTKQKPQAQQIVKLEYYDGVTWQTLSDESYVEDKSLQICWDLLNDDTEVIWQPL